MWKITARNTCSPHEAGSLLFKNIGNFCFYERKYPQRSINSPRANAIPLGEALSHETTGDRKHFHWLKIKIKSSRIRTRGTQAM